MLVVTSIGRGGAVFPPPSFTAEVGCVYHPAACVFGGGWARRNGLTMNVGRGSPLTEDCDSLHVRYPMRQTVNGSLRSN
jgi:hypothetical protein